MALVVSRTCKCKDYSGNPPKQQYDKNECERIIKEDNEKRRARGEEVDDAGWCVKASMLTAVVLPLSWLWSAWLSSIY